MNCFLCKQPAVDTMVFETGNNAEYKVEPNMCEVHFKEAENTGYDFEEKYAEPKKLSPKRRENEKL